MRVIKHSKISYQMSAHAQKHAKGQLTCLFLERRKTEEGVELVKTTFLVEINSANAGVSIIRRIQNARKWSTMMDSICLLLKVGIYS